MQPPVLAHEILRRSDLAQTRAFFAALSAGLSVAELGGVPEAGVAAPGSREARARDEAPGAFMREGVLELGEVVDGETARRAVDTIGSFVERGIPAVFAYVFDELWQIGERVRAVVESVLGDRYVSIDDVWAWRIAKGGAGWPAHRGSSDLLDRRSPELVNTWVALSDVEVDRSCMHLVPLDRDPSYPENLASTDVVDPSAVRAAPLRAGGGIAWNANVLHWGGPCAETASDARTSCSFSLVRADALDRLGFAAVDTARLDLRARLSSIARQIRVYGAGQPDVTRELLDWAVAEGVLGSFVNQR